MYSFSDNTLRLTGTGSRDIEHMQSWGPGIRPCYIIHFVVRGAGYLKMNDKEYRIEEGESFLTWPFTLIEYYPDQDNPWEYMWVDFTGEMVREWITHTGFDKNHPVCAGGLSAKLLPEFRKLQNTDIYQKNANEAFGIFMTILGIYRDGFPAQENRETQRNECMETAVKLIRSNYHQSDFNSESLYRMMNISRTTLYRSFRAGIGKSPNRFLTECRMEQAKKMLLLGTSVKNTALSCGYLDIFYFSRTFKKFVGCPPSEYAKKQYKNNEHEENIECLGGSYGTDKSNNQS